MIRGSRAELYSPKSDPSGAIEPAGLRLLVTARFGLELKIALPIWPALFTSCVPLLTPAELSGIQEVEHLQAEWQPPLAPDWDILENCQIVIYVSGQEQITVRRGTRIGNRLRIEAAGFN